MKPVRWINLNKNNSMLMHNVFGAQNDGSAVDPREKYVLHSQLEDNRRVLTVRTLYLLRNQTKVQYSVRIFYQDLTTKQVIICADVRLMPGQSMPLPDHADKALQQRIKIAIRPSQCRKWSQEFRLQAIKDKILPEMNVVWQHHETYSILRKEPTLLKHVFDLVLVPPVIIKSCLPFKMTIDICGNKKSDSITPSQAEEGDTYTRQVLLDKQDEQFLQDVKKYTGELTLLL